MDIRERILKYLDACPPAISGNNGHSQTFYVACKLYQGFNLTESEVLEYLRIYNRRCDPPWDERSLSRKANQAAISKKHLLPAGHLISRNGAGFHKEDLSPPAPRHAEVDPVLAANMFLKGFSCDESDLADASPIQPSDDWTRDGILVLEHLFRPGEIVNFVTGFVINKTRSGVEKSNPGDCGSSVERDALIAKWRNEPLPCSDAGGWLRINPVDGKGVSDQNITAFRVALLEFDKIPAALQLSIFSKLPLPIAAILTSGGKSIHAWVRIDADDHPDYEASVVRIREAIRRFGIDRQNKNPSRLSRLPGVRRIHGASGDGRQRLIYLNPNPTQKSIL